MVSEHGKISRRAAVLISADAEWQAIRELFPAVIPKISPFGEVFSTHLKGWECKFIQGGWGKISAAASTQYAIDRYDPELLINLGTCGGISGQIERGAVVLVERTVVYDIFEQMGDPAEHIAHYSCEVDLSWLHEPYPIPVVRTLLVSGDRDLLAEDLPILRDRYHASAGDWETGAIAWVASRNHRRILILRGVTDLVDETGSAAYGNLAFFERAAFGVMQQLVNSLPGWLAAAE